MGVTQIIETLDTSKGWLEASNVTGTNGAFVIAIKGSHSETSACNLADVKYIVLEIGIPSGIENKPITLQCLKLNFSDITSFDDLELDMKTACARIGALPSTIYMKPVAYADASKEYKTGTMPISINVLPF